MKAGVDYCKCCKSKELFDNYIDSNGNHDENGRQVTICQNCSTIQQDYKKEKPYLKVKKAMTELKYNPNYGDNRICECSHVYYRHFYMYDGMKACGCKYCSCFTFKESKTK